MDNNILTPEVALSQPVENPSLVLPLLSLIFGGLSVLLSCAYFLSVPIAIISIILGQLSFYKNSRRRVLAIIGICLSCVIVLIWVSYTFYNRFIW